MTRADQPGATRLMEIVYVACPYNIAQKYLAADVDDHVQKPRIITLRVPIADLNLSKNVVVTFAPGVDPMHMEQPWRVHWTPEAGGPFPDFDGELTVRADEDWNTSILELQGTYVPPGGPLGYAFDRVAGKQIAALTAQSLLENIAHEFELRYREQENKKHAAPTQLG